MAKRTRHEESAELPLFDLPLHGDAAQPPAARPEAAPPDAARPEAAPPEAAPPEATPPDAAPPDDAARATRGPSILFDEPEADDGGDQLDLVELGRTAEPDDPEADASDAGWDDDDLDDESALLGDRLLGGLADLAVQLLMLGLAVAATHSMDVPVTFADWPPFTVLAAVFSFLYWVVPLAFWGQTPGMAWVGHTARALDGEPLTFSQTFRRWLGSVLTLALAGLPMLLALTGRSLTDRLSSSETVCV